MHGLRKRRLRHLAVELLALLHPVGNGPLPGSRALSKGGATSKGTCGSPVADADDADIVHAGHGTLTSHSRRHLNLEWEVSVSGQADTLDAESWDVLGHFGSLEGRRICASRGGINGGIQRPSTVLVDLYEKSRSV